MPKDGGGGQTSEKRRPGHRGENPGDGSGLIAIKALKKEGIATLGTAVYGAAQGLLAALAGAKYVAPYVNRVDAQGGDGIRMVQELQSLLEMHAPKAECWPPASKRRGRRWTACWRDARQSRFP